MSSSNWKPWWMKISDLDSAHEREEFLRGMGGGQPKTGNNNGKNVLLAVIAGYMGGRAASKSKGNQ